MRGFWSGWRDSRGHVEDDGNLLDSLDRELLQT